MNKVRKLPILLILAAFFVFFSVSNISFAVSQNQNNNAGKINPKTFNNSGSAIPTTSATPTVPVVNNGQITAEAHRSAVANFVQNLLQTADRNGGIGQQVRIIAQQQSDSVTSTAATIKKIQDRNKIKTFLIGSDYKNLGALRSDIVQTRNRLDQLNRLIDSTNSTATKTTIQEQINTLEQEQTQLNNFVKTQENKFSLFGWLVKLFTK
ncbi:MAG: hypothetical protein PHV78_03665 [Patescibacteria group bacterium]|nr:hypothetical protein [Patescibacteria group bacterium]MDD5121515.1 hypothetical protein [Patescibacteria group bacterium]MDD5221845.1 hypothetical protein [Patescibacteria group bacterium]MDD5396322.1 hypothetical protein [Patescibacteria group bacterium]